MLLSSSVLEKVPGIRHGFGTQEEPLPSVVEPFWTQSRPLWKQVHGVSIAHVQTVGQECGEVDALYTRNLELPIGVMTADCVPILLAHQEGHAVAAVHAGWRGTRARILRELWKKLKAEGENPKNWVAAIGPSIGPCCYEVSEELAQNFLKEFREMDPSWVMPRKRILNLPKINAEELKDIGIAGVEILNHCTRCSTNPYFHSFRREGGGTRQWSVAVRV